MIDLIDDSHTAYIKGRMITDNVCASEILHKIRIFKTQEILFKLDFEKAFDGVN